MGDVFKDKRGGRRFFKFTLADRTVAQNYIKSIPSESSHYPRKKSTKEYIAFKKRNPEDQVSYKFYRKVFMHDFPNLKFRKPRADTCKASHRLNNENKHGNVILSAKASSEL
ncbi:hypothetical protein PR048_025176 [Dryococelus australis]|uniref:Uncharacterized protein n=1 Tax=Dryococelus australis TaxID=614101 RepID=A0ABQ9GQK0_9NEOP|nr:hypothetical protein PR048_025176 [Dryococelus australis]